MRKEKALTKISPKWGRENFHTMCPRMRRDNTHTIKTKIRKRRRSLNSTQNEEEKTATQLGPKGGRDHFHTICPKTTSKLKGVINCTLAMCYQVWGSYDKAKLKILRDIIYWNNSHCDLDLWSSDLKIKRGQPFPMSLVPIKSKDHRLMCWKSFLY